MDDHNSAVLKQKPKFDWYETEQFVVIDIMIKQVDPEKINVQMQPRRLLFSYQQQDCSSQNQTPIIHELVLNLNGQIIPSDSSWKVTPFKVEIKMRKSDNHRWQKLEMADDSTQLISPTMNDSIAQGDNSVLDKAQVKTKCWDEMVKQMEKEDEEKDNDVSDLFKKIYLTGDENLRRAMNKSFVESNGTVLSTNWKDVSKAKVDVKPPESCEYRKWDS